MVCGVAITIDFDVSDLAIVFPMEFSPSCCFLVHNLLLQEFWIKLAFVSSFGFEINSFDSNPIHRYRIFKAQRFYKEFVWFCQVVGKELS
jgi:hypothetical protein